MFRPLWPYTAITYQLSLPCAEATHCSSTGRGCWDSLLCQNHGGRGIPSETRSNPALRNPKTTRDNPASEPTGLISAQDLNDGVKSAKITVRCIFSFALAVSRCRWYTCVREFYSETSKGGGHSMVASTIPSPRFQSINTTNGRLHYTILGKEWD